MTMMFKPKKSIIRIIRKVSPEGAHLIESLRTLDPEIRDLRNRLEGFEKEITLLREKVENLDRDLDESRRLNLRAAELMDIAFMKLSG